jgi:hypothetical protein
VRVIALGAWCDYVTENEERDRLSRLVPTDVGARPNSEPHPGRWAPINEQAIEEALENFRHGLHFRVQEFADLDDGRRITLHDERGYSTSGPADPWRFQTPESIEADVRTTVLPDDDDGEEHPWEWLVELLHAHDVDVSVEQLRQVPYRVELSSRLRAKLQDSSRGAVS